MENIVPGFYIGSISRHQERYEVETSVSTTIRTSAGANSKQDLQGSGVTREEAQTGCIASVNKMVQQVISRIIV
jgi:hypothetical protein